MPNYSNIFNDYNCFPEVTIRFDPDTMKPTTIFFYGETEEITERLQEVVDKLFPEVMEGNNE